MLSLRRNAARGLDVLAVLIVLAAVIRFVVVPRLHHSGPVPAPPLALATLEGGPFELARQRGRVVFLDFYATWCDPCRASIPLVQHFRRTHPQAVVESIDVGESVALARPFAAGLEMRNVALDPDQTAAHALGVQGFPTMLAIGPDGLIRARWVGFDPGVERAMAGVLAALR